jgi:heterogeneous nuclear ribonucleoprotein L
MMLSCARYGMKPDYGREPLHPAPPRSGYGPPAIPQAPGGPNTSGPQQGSVMMVYGLDPEKSNADKLFNIFCLYGNVLRVSVTVLDVFDVVCSGL